MTVRRWITILMLSLAATSMVAQTRETPVQRTTEPVTAETDRDIDNPRAMRLSLDEAIRTAMERNLGIHVQNYDVRMAGESLRSQYGIYDWIGSATVERESFESANTSSFQASGGDTTRVNAGVGQNLPAGGDYFLGLNTSRTTTTGGGTTVSPAFRPTLVFSATQPLLRNFGIDVNRRFILIARNTLGISREQFRTVVMNTAVSVEQAYLDLVYARRNVEVVKEALFLARDQARITQIRIDVGASAPLDILQPRVQIATSEETLILTVASVRDAEDRLRALMNLPVPEWDRPIVPTDPVDYTPVTIDTNAAVARALELRPEVRQQGLTTETRRVQYLYARNQTLPQLDFNVDYSAAGISGRARNFDPVTGEPTGTFTTTRGGTAFRQVLENDFPSWTVGFTASVPLTNIGARAEARRAELDLQLARTNEELTRQNISVDVRKAVRDVDTTARSITATRAAREAAERNLEAERRRYENGMTTNFQVLQVQQQLSDARVREIAALVGYNQAVANYHRAVGDILEVRNIRLEEPEVSPEPPIFSNLDRYHWLNYGSRVKDDVEAATNDDKRQ